ncbi:Odorant receptor 317 [Nylanderia fulva]|uniref:Odorant receptor n=1 Tax=Nylanderia fulva TaxID=613905 RepID=A0A6G1LPH9_9HYME|nr:Odorant receptor 317 [Nylanderia fulva]
MDFVGEQYYKFNRFFLLCLGLWPDHPYSSLKKIQVIFFETLLISFLLFQFNAFFLTKRNMDIIIKISMYVVIDIIFIIKYNAYFLLIHYIHYIYDRVKYDWKILKTQAELKIIRGYGNNAKLCTISFALIITISVPIMYILICVPCILDIIVPMNESRPRSLPVLLKYFFIDEKVNFHIRAVHIMIVLYVGCMTMVAIATLLIAYSLHTCAMFKIASYRMDHIFEENIQRMPKHLKQYVFYEKLIYAVYIHRRALDLATTLTNSFSTLYFILVGCGVCSITLTIFNFFSTLSWDNISNSTILLGIIGVHLYYIIVGNVVGQELIDTSTGINKSICHTQWYAAPLWMQKSMLFVMQRSDKRSTLTALYLFDASLEGLATLLSMTMSYVMLLQSVGS